MRKLSCLALLNLLPITKDPSILQYTEQILSLCISAIRTDQDSLQAETS